MYQSGLLYKAYAVFRSQKNFNFPSQKIEFLFSPCKVRSLLLSKSSVREERSKKEQILLKKEQNLKRMKMKENQREKKTNPKEKRKSEN